MIGPQAAKLGLLDEGGRACSPRLRRSPVLVNARVFLGRCL